MQLSEVILHGERQLGTNGHESGEVPRRPSKLKRTAKLFSKWRSCLAIGEDELSGEDVRKGMTGTVRVRPGSNSFASQISENIISGNRHSVRGFL